MLNQGLGAQRFAQRDAYFVAKQGNEFPDKDQAGGLFSQGGKKRVTFAMWFVTQNTPGRQLEASQENSILPVMLGLKCPFLPMFIK